MMNKLENTNHTTYGGRIYNNDFDCYHSIADIASRIISDQKFDKACRNNADARNHRITDKQSM